MRREIARNDAISTHVRPVPGERPSATLWNMMIEADALHAPSVHAPADERGYYSVSQAATLLGVNRVTIWRWIRPGRPPASRVGNRTTRIARADLERALTRVGGNSSRLRLVPEPEQGVVPT